MFDVAIAFALEHWTWLVPWIATPLALLTPAGPLLGFLRGNWQWVLIAGALAWGAIAQIGWERCSAATARADADRTAAVLKAQQAAAALSDELIIAQAQAMANTDRKVVTYVDRIRRVVDPDGACPADRRMQLGSHGVRDIVGGDGAEAGGGPADGLPRPPAGAQPR